MKTEEYLERLRTHESLFTSIPTHITPRICGLESEYGCINFTEFSSEYLLNGGEMYTDCGHPEYATPEVSNPLSAVLYYEAGKQLAHLKKNGDKKMAERLYCNNNAWHHVDNPSWGTTFAAHESYATRFNRPEWGKLIPFLIARTILCGIGWVDEKGEYQISQRAKYIQEPMSEETKYSRGIINLRHDPLMCHEDYDRLHLICGDATMNEVATLLRVGTMSLILEIFEMKAAPIVKYDYEKAVGDFQALSRRREGWYLDGLQNRDKSAVSLLSDYHTRATELFSKRDTVTDLILVVWKDTLEKLERNPMELVCRLDWVTKLYLLEKFKEEEGETTSDCLRDLDMEYHRLDPDFGYYYLLRNTGRLERLVSDDLICTAMFEPPPDTRAYARGKLVEYLALKSPSLQVFGDWDQLAVADQAGNDQYEIRPMPDPFCRYDDLLNEFKARFV